MPARGEIRLFPTTWKLKAIKRAEGDEGVVPVARTLGLSPKFCMTGSKRGKLIGLKERTASAGDGHGPSPRIGQIDQVRSIYAGLMPGH
jgi:hypothetical protein